MRILIESKFGQGAFNMAVDSAIAEAVTSQLQPPTLRLYGWAPFCLSLGYGQRARDVDVAALQARGWGMTRRPTGGKAILHGDELTYSLCLPLEHPLARGNVIESYRRLSAGLLRALAHLGLEASAEKQAPQSSAQAPGPVCFALPSHYEITVAGRKLIGSAQLRRRGTLLQHGTLPLTGDVARICDVLRFKTEARRQQEKMHVRRRAITLKEILGVPPTWQEAAAAMARGFCESLRLEGQPGELSQAESERAAALSRERFANPDFIFKR